MKKNITRRNILTASAAASVAACAPAKPGKAYSSKTELPSGVFKLGIASGDPHTTSVVLWTHISPIDPRQNSVPVEWQISLTPDMRDPVMRGQDTATRAKDWTFKAIPKDLEAGQVYFYQFKSEGALSPIGRTRTLPVGAVDKLRFAVVSCANWQQGYFNVYDHISRSGDFDALIHLGDYFYEYGVDKANDAMTKAGRLHQPPHEVLTLEDYRIRHAQYRSDPNLQATTANMPMIPIWDDHESSNDSWKDGAENHQESEGDWADRKQAALRAYFEWMPVRPPETGRALSAFYRDYKWGDLMRLFVWETRLFARGEPVIIEEHFDLFKTPEGIETFKSEILNDPSRHMLGAQQESEVLRALSDSKTAGETWRVIGNQVVMARLTTPDLTPYVSEEVISEIEKQWPPIRQFVELSKHRLPVYPDSWDGYAVARESLFESLDAAGINDLLVLTGDAHEYWANDLTRDNGTKMGVELGTSSVSSETLEAFMGDAVKEYALLMTRSNPDVAYYNAENSGYMDLTLTPTKGQVRFMAVDTVETTNYRAYETAKFDIKKKGTSLKLDNPKGLDVKQRLLFTGLG
ncbi:MAG: alkaline phosphatase D family protein [Maricaulaceae bacterium]